ncbi:MAG: carboxypeptidase-like regulatory domain-containing protein [Gemmatimonadaceae bacterium]|nr:carboxypeptidase-like regulatory domain-containing protein [Gemmatimonadaceae bacterium]
MITGRVSASNGGPLASATVTIEALGLRAMTNDQGRYTLTVPALDAEGDVTISARRIGYRMERKRITLHRGMRDTVDFALTASSLHLSEVIVTTPMRNTADFAAGGYAIGQAPAARFMMRGAPGRTAAPEVRRALQSADEVIVLADSAVPERVDAAPGEPPRPTQGVLRARTRDGQPAGEFPLRHTDVAAEISGALARTVVEQRYTNPYRQAIEAVYVFPLPALAAVNDFVMQAGDRKIVGVVRPRAEAERLYREALARGQTASLLTQERPNIFTQSVANIEPGGEVTIRITYFERVPYDHGEYEYVFPMVVGPRYIPRGSDAQLASNPPAYPHDEAGSGDTTIVPDAHRINPPVLRPGERSGHDISLTVTLDAALPITRLRSVAHEVEIERPSAERRVVRLASHDSIPNRDFVLRWSVAGAETQFGVLTHRDSTGGYLTLTMQPPVAPRDDQVTPREITFIMDVSGSMMGLPIDMSKALVTRTLDRLRPDDRFNIVYFAAGNAQLWDRARPRTPENVAEAKRFLAHLSAGGGTEMLAGVVRALRAPHDPAYVQMFVFLTDGFVGDEARVLSTIKTERGDARFFGFGIGSSVNRYLIDGIGEVGGGTSLVVLPREPAYAERAVSRLFDAIDSPVLVDVAIDWNGLPVEEVYPHKLRDLFAGQTIDVIARYTAPARGTAYVTGRIGARRVRYPVHVDLPATAGANAALAPAWARAKIADLSTVMLGASEPRQRELERTITDLAVRYRLVSQYTAFVAVDASRIVSDGRPIRVLQPVELPEGVSYEGIFGGERPVGPPMRIGAWGVDVIGTDSGNVRVATVERGAAARAGVRRGARLRTVNGAPIHDLAGLEAVLLQSGGGQVAVELQPGGRVTLPSP